MVGERGEVCGGGCAGRERPSARRTRRVSLPESGGQVPSSADSIRNSQTMRHLIGAPQGPSSSSGTVTGSPTTVRFRKPRGLQDDADLDAALGASGEWRTVITAPSTPAPRHHTCHRAPLTAHSHHAQRHSRPKTHVIAGGQCPKPQPRRRQGTGTAPADDWTAQGPGANLLRSSLRPAYPATPSRTTGWGWPACLQRAGVYAGCSTRTSR